MGNLLLALLHVVVMAARLCGPGGVRAVIAGNLLLKQQLIVLRRARRRAPKLSVSDRLLFGFESLFVTPGRIRQLAIVLRPSTLLAFHRALVRRKSHPFVERLIGTMRREFLDHVPFWNGRELERKLTEFQRYYNAARSHASLEGHTPLTFPAKLSPAPADLSRRYASPAVPADSCRTCMPESVS